MLCGGGRGGGGWSWGVGGVETFFWGLLVLG